MEHAIDRIVIVGGGTAGWLSAAILASKLSNKSPNPKKIVLIESPDIKTVGVGEGTWPTMRRTLSQIGISEHNFLTKCQASFKQGTRFVGWKDGSKGDDYYHPFGLPAEFPKINAGAIWLDDSADADFAEAFSVQSHLCHQDIAPKHFKTPEYNGLQNYGYHLDAGLFAELLREHCTQRLGVEHIQANVQHIEQDQNGFISRLRTDTSEVIAGDFYIDCTGFQAKLIGQTLSAEFTSVADHLFADRAMVISKQYPQKDSPIASQTNSTAQSAGWIWDIGLKHRRGIGYVYSSSHITDVVAEEELLSYVKSSGGDYDEQAVRTLKFQSGYRATPWKKNCLAIGLSAGFVEPLEASSIMMVELASNFLAQRWPETHSILPILAKQYNALSELRWHRIVDFLKLHYCLSKRETDFWNDNRSVSTIPESLNDKLELWKFYTPWRDDFTQAQEIFPTASYQYVLYGMSDRRQGSGNRQSLTEQIKTKVEAEAAQLISALPTNRELLGSVEI